MGLGFRVFGAQGVIIQGLLGTMVLGLGFGVKGSHLLGFGALFGIWAF